MQKKKKGKKIHSITEKKSPKLENYEHEHENNKTILGNVTLDGRVADP